MLAPRAPSRTLADACLAGLAALASVASAAPRLDAAPVFSALRNSDCGALTIVVQNDETPRDAVIEALRFTPGTEDAQPMVTRVEVALAPGARRELTLPLSASPAMSCRVDLRVGDEVVASTSTRVDWAMTDRPLVGCLGPAPASLVAACRHELDAGLVEIRLRDLPGNDATWPRFAAVAWPSPRASDLDAGQAAALRRFLRAGSRLAVGANAEDPDALERLGLADLAPARLEAGSGPELVASPVDGGTFDGESWRRAAGLGSVRLLPRDLARGEVPWRSLLGLEPPPVDNGRRRWSPPPRPGYLGTANLPQVHQHDLRPQPPTGWAAGLLGLFFLAAVPLDAWLTRRSLRRARRSRLGWLRYPAIVTIVTIMAFALAGGVGARDVALYRYDVVHVDAGGGPAAARTLLQFARGRAGVMELAGDEVHWVDVLQPESGYLNWAAPGALVARVARDAPADRRLVAVPSWGRREAEAAWDPERARLPPIQLEVATTVAGPEARVSTPFLAARSVPSAAHPEARSIRILSRTAPSPAETEASAQLARLPSEAMLGLGSSTQPSILLVLEGASGPRITAAGREASPDRSFTLLICAIPEPQVEPPATETTPLNTREVTP